MRGPGTVFFTNKFLKSRDAVPLSKDAEDTLQSWKIQQEGRRYIYY